MGSDYMPVPFDSRKIYYRSPFGAVEQGTEIHFRILLPKTEHTQKAQLCVKYDYDYNWEFTELIWCGKFDEDTEIWECDFTPKKIGLYWYNFKLTAIDKTRYVIPSDPYKVSTIEDYMGRSWQITCYKKGFKTPDWLVGGIMYQIFPDRFYFSGEEKNIKRTDFKRNKDNIPAKVATVEYDPNRSANIALLHYADGEKRYIIAPYGLKVGETIVSGEASDIKVGNALPLKNIPVGTMIHCIELLPGKGAQLVRSAGNAAQLLAKETKYAQVRLPSGEVRLIPLGCKATIGQVGNIDSVNIKLGKAGRTRHMGFRPTVRGSVMNPNDHPHGGGEGKSPIGRPGPVTPWGKPALGYKTRKTKNINDKYIVRRRDGK